MSLRILVRLLREGEILESSVEATPEMTVTQLVASLSLPPLVGQVPIVLFQQRYVPGAMRLEDLFVGWSESERILLVAFVPTAVRDLLSDALADQEADGEAEDEFDDDDDDYDDEIEEVEERHRAPPPRPPAAPGAPAPAPPPPSAAWNARQETPLPRSRSRDEDLDDLASQAPMSAEPEDVASRRATVRYYDRMNPQKVFPFMVTLTAEKVKKILQRGVSQAESKTFEVKLEEFVQIEPILPGCTCYPAKSELKLTAADTAVHFWVVPQVLGKVRGAKVTISQEGRTLSEVELDIRVRKTTLALVVGLMTLLYPVIAAVLKQFGIDFKNLGPMGEYLSVINDSLRTVSPLVIFGAMTLLTVLLYWWTRPRQRDQFWDLETK
jgi:hypothetical protein